MNDKDAVGCSIQWIEKPSLARSISRDNSKIKPCSKAGECEYCHVVIPIAKTSSSCSLGGLYHPGKWLVDFRGLGAPENRWSCCESPVEHATGCLKRQHLVTHFGLY